MAKLKPLEYSPPESGETLAVTYDLPKVSALYYDRIWNPARWPGVWNPISSREGEHPLPKEVGTNFGQYDDDLRDWAMVGQLGMQQTGPGTGFSPPSPGPLRDAMLVDAPDVASQVRMQARLLAQRLGQTPDWKNEYGIVPVYSSLVARDQEYRAGDYEVLAVTLTGLRIVDEDQLTWEQVLEFRRDKENRKKYIRFRHWLDMNMAGQPLAVMEDAIRFALEDYESAINKHGLQTVMGSVADLVDSASIVTLGASALPQLSLAAFGVSGVLAITGLAVKTAKRKIVAADINPGLNHEIAFVHEVSKLSPDS